MPQAKRTQFHGISPGLMAYISKLKIRQRFVIIEKFDNTLFVAHFFTAFIGQISRKKAEIKGFLMKFCCD